MGDFFVAVEVELSWLRVSSRLRMRRWCQWQKAKVDLLIQSLHILLPVPGLCGPVMAKRNKFDAGMEGVREAFGIVVVGYAWLWVVINGEFCIWDSCSGWRFSSGTSQGWAEKQSN